MKASSFVTSVKSLFVGALVMVLAPACGDGSGQLASHQYRQQTKACKTKSCEQQCDKAKHEAKKDCKHKHKAQRKLCKQAAKQADQACHQTWDGCKQQCRQEKKQAHKDCRKPKGKKHKSCKHAADKTAHDCEQACRNSKKQCHEEKKQAEKDCKRNSDDERAQCVQTAKQVRSECKKACSGEPAEILRVYPADGAVVTELKPTIYAEWADPSGQAPAEVHLLIDGQEVTEQAELSESSLQYTPAADLPAGQHNLKLEVVSQTGQKVTAESQFTVDPNPALLILNPFDAIETAVENEPYSLAVEAQSKDEQPLSFSLPQAPAGMTIDAQDGIVSWTPAAGQGGEHTVTVQVTNGTNVAQRSFKLRVASLKAEASATVPAAQGGKVEVTDPASPIFGASIDIPAGALTADTQITLSSVEFGPPISPSAIRAGPQVHVKASGSGPAIAATLLLPKYSDVAPGPGDLEALSVWSKGAFSAGGQDSDGSWTIGALEGKTDGLLIRREGAGEIWEIQLLLDSEIISDGAFNIVQKSNGAPSLTFSVEKLIEGLKHSYDWYGDRGWPLPTPITVELRDRCNGGAPAHAEPLRKFLCFDPSNKQYSNKKDFVLSAAAHEVFHLIQGLPTSLGKERWWVAESTAVFMADEVYDNVNDYVRHVRPDFPRYSLNRYRDVSDGNSLLGQNTRSYHGVVFFKYLKNHQLLMELFTDPQYSLDKFGFLDNHSLDVLNKLLGGKLAQKYLEFVHHYTVVFDVAGDESNLPAWQNVKTKWSSRIQMLNDTHTKEKPLPLAIPDWGNKLEQMSGRTYRVKVDEASPSSGGSVVVRFKDCADGMLAKICPDLDGTGSCLDLGPVKIKKDGQGNNPEIILDGLPTDSQRSFTVTLVNGSPKNSASCTVQAFIDPICETQVVGSVFCQSAKTDNSGLPIDFPVNGVKISLDQTTDESGAAPVTCTTGASGSYSCPPQSSLQYPCDLTELTISAQLGSEEFSTEWTSGAVEPWGMTWGSPKLLGKTVLPADWFNTTVTGKVVDGSGNGVDGATVTIEGLEGRTETDANGEFSIPDLNICGVEEIVVRAEILEESATSSSVATKAGGTTDVGNIVFSITTEVVGRVLVRDKPKCGVAVTVTVADDPSFSVKGSTNCDGRFSVTSVPALLGAITVEATYMQASGEEASGESAPTTPVPRAKTDVHYVHISLPYPFFINQKHNHGFNMEDKCTPVTYTEDTPREDIDLSGLTGTRITSPMFHWEADIDPPNALITEIDLGGIRSASSRILCSWPAYRYYCGYWYGSHGPPVDWNDNVANCGRVTQRVLLDGVTVVEVTGTLDSQIELWWRGEKIRQYNLGQTFAVNVHASKVRYELECLDGLQAFCRHAEAGVVPVTAVNNDPADFYLFYWGKGTAMKVVNDGYTIQPK